MPRFIAAIQSTNVTSGQATLELIPPPGKSIRLVSVLGTSTGVAFSPYGLARSTSAGVPITGYRGELMSDVRSPAQKSQSILVAAWAALPGAPAVTLAYLFLPGTIGAKLDWLPPVSPVISTSFLIWNLATTGSGGSFTIEWDEDDALAAVRSTYADAVRADNPVAYWRMDDVAGTTLADALGAYPITFANAANKTFGVAGAFAGSAAIAFANSVRGTIAANPAPTSTFTIELWLRPNGASVLAFQTILITTPAEEGLYWDGTARKLNYFFGSTNHFSATTLTMGTLYHVALSMAAGVGTFYINGVADGGFSGAGALAFVQLFNNVSANTGLTATVDDLAVYPTALSAAQILAHYRAAV